MILTVSNVERSLAFYEAALKPLHIKFFMPYKGKDGHPDHVGITRDSVDDHFRRHVKIDPRMLLNSGRVGNEWSRCVEKPPRAVATVGAVQRFVKTTRPANVDGQSVPVKSASTRIAYAPERAAVATR
jgi:hypothetical protein